MSLKGVLGHDDASAIKTHSETLQAKLSELGAHLYEQPTGQQQAGESAANDTDTKEPDSAKDSD